jgi:hypothetical protein
LASLAPNGRFPKGQNQYALLEALTTIGAGSGRQGDLVPLRVYRWGDAIESELTLLILRELLPEVANFFQRIVDPVRRETR